jgi:peptide/nickel transport system permease protein
MRYFSRRLLHSAILLVGVSALSFAFITLAPGDYFSEMRMNPQIAPERVSALRAQFALERPLPLRYAAWLRSAAKGQFGYSFAYNSPVGPLLWSRARIRCFLLLFPRCSHG